MPATAGWISREQDSAIEYLREENRVLKQQLGLGESRSHGRPHKSRIPTDRPIDGIDQSDFILGEQEKSNREYAVTYVGDTIFAVKWRNMKVHFATAEGTHSVIQKYTFPQVYDIKEDPKESFELWGNEGYAHAWVMSPVSKILSDLHGSMAKYPNIAPGHDFQGYD